MTLDELQKLCDAATPGPWAPSICKTPHWSGEPNAARLGEVWDDNGYASEEDCNFIAAARTYMPRLIAVARAALRLPPAGRLLCGQPCGCAECQFDQAFDDLEKP